MVASSTPLGAGSVTNVDEMTIVNTEATISVTKNDGVASLNPGSPTTYTIMISNAGPSDLTGATVSDMFPAGIASTSTTSVAAGGATGNTAGPFAGNINDTVTIPPGGSITYTVVAQTDPAATGSLANTVNVTGGAMTVPGTTSATDTDTLTPSGNLSISKTDSPDPVMTGTALTYTITVANSGPSTATGVTVTDTFPAQFTNPMWSCLAAGAGSSCAPMGAGNLAAESVNIGPGGSVTFTVTSTITTAIATQITNTASLTVPMGFTDGDGVGNNTAMEMTDLTVNDPPMASTAGSSTAGVVGELLTLMGSNSTDDGLPAPPAMLTFDWTFTSVPAGSAISTGSTFSTSADTMFTPDIAGTYMATLTVDDSLANNQAMLTVTVSAASTTTAITSDMPDPSALNSAYTVSGTVTANAPSGATVNEGTVDVTGGSTCMSAVTSGAFSCMVTSMTAGAKTLVATYNATTNFNGSVSAGEAHTVNMGTTTTSVDSSSPTPSILPNAFQVNFTVTGMPAAPGPAGMVTVSLSGGGSCMGTVAAGTCMLTPTMTGMQTLTATYPGDLNYQGSADATGIPHTVSPPPMAVADMFDIIGNTPFEHAGTQTITEGLFFAGSVLSNDTGIGIMVTSASPIATALGASVTINAAGEFIYDGDAVCGPPGDTNTSDSFMYTITGDTMATVTLDCDAQVWWVKNDDTGGDTGTHANPFQTLAQADGVVNSNSGNGDTIFVYEGDGTTTGQNSGITLLNIQRLIGEGIALTIDSTLNMVDGPHTLTAAGNQPKISGASPGVTVTDVSAVISGLDITAGTGGGIGDNGISVNCFNTAIRTVEISNNTVAGVQHGIFIINGGCTYELDISNNHITDAGEISTNDSGIVVAGAGQPTFITNFDSNTVDGISTAGVLGTGIQITGATFDATPGGSFQMVTGGTTTIGVSTSDRVGMNGLVLGGAGGGNAVNGNLVFTDLDIFATGTGLAVVGSGALTASTGFGLTVPDGSTIDSSSGGAIDLDPLTTMFGTSGGSQVTISGQSASFDQVAGMLFFSSTSALTGGTGDVYSQTSSTADITYAGTVVDNTGTGITLSMNGAGGSASFTSTVDLGVGTDLTNAALEMTGNNATFAANFADLDIVTNGATGIFGTTNGMLDIDAGTVMTTGAPGVDITGIGFGTTVDLTTITVVNPGGGINGIELDGVSGNFNVSGTTTIGGTGAGSVGTGIVIQNSSAIVGFANVDIGVGAGPATVANGVNLSSNTGTSTFTSLDIANTGGTGLFASGGGAINTTSGTISTTSGRGIDVGTSVLNATFTGVSAAGAQHGIRLSTVTGILNAGTGMLTPTNTGTSIGLDIDAGTVAFTYAGSINGGASNRTVEITNMTGGGATLSGALIDENGIGISLSGNTGGTFTFSGASVDVDTATNTGVNLSSNGGATINFTGGGLDIVTTIATGFNATGGGTVNITGTGNTATSTTGRAVNIQSTTIGTSGITFQSVNSTGGTHGIDINNGGTTGFFTVAGVSTTNGSGGTIQSTTQNGILIQNTDNITLNNMNLTNAANEAGGSCTAVLFTGCTASLEFNTVKNVVIDNMAMNGSNEHGLFGQTVTNLDISNSSFTSLGSGTDENAIFVVNLLGTTAAGAASVFDNITITGAGDNGIQINNSTSTNAGNTASPDILTVQNGSTINTSGVSGILAVTDTSGTGNFRLDVTGSNFSGNAATGIATNANGGDLQTNITSNMILHGAGTQFRGVDGQATSTGDLFFTVTGNTITANNGNTGVGPAVIAYANNGTGTMNGTIGGAGALTNTLTNNTALGTPVAGVSLINNGNGSSFVTLNNNTITVPDGFGVIANVQGTNTGAGHFHVLGNTVSVTPGVDIANTAISATNSSSAGTECLNISANTVTTTPAGNFDIGLAHTFAPGAFQVQQTTGTTTAASLDLLPNTQLVETEISAAQTGANDVAGLPFNSGDFTQGTCTAPTNP